MCPKRVAHNTEGMAVDGHGLDPSHIGVAVGTIGALGERVARYLAA